MLNGIAPILIFTFPFLPKGPTFNAISGIPLVGSFIASNIGLPIPIYLDEKLTGLYVESESKAIDIDTQPQQRYDGKPPDVAQRGLNSLISVNMVAQKDSVLLAVLLAINDIIFQKVVSREYSVSYLNGPSTIFNGLLHGFSTNTGTDDDLIRIVMQISKANQQGTIPNNIISVLPKVTGAIPVAGVTP